MITLSICTSVEGRLESGFTWVNTAGLVSSYGSDSAQGWIHLFVDIECWAKGFIAFTVPPLGSDEILIHPPPSVNFTLYVTRIVNASIIKLDYYGSDLFMIGFWEVGSVVNPITTTDVLIILQNMTLTPGELSITGNWTSFSVNLDGYQSVQGNITSYCVREIQPSPWVRYPYGDINNDFRIDMKDIGSFARAFGSVLGIARYNFLADINFDLKTDIRDIAMCVSRFGMIY
jgi:hypothetical protein